VNEVAAGGGWGDYDERSARLVEAIHVIRRLWTGETVHHQGDFYQIKGARLYDPPPQPIPIYMAAGGPKSTRLAGEHGDGLITDPKSAVKPEIRQAFAEGARAAGKNPDQLPIICEHWVCVGDRDAAEKSAQLWRYQPKAWDEFVFISDPAEIERRAEQDVPLDQALSTFTVSEDPNRHARVIQQLFDGGITTLLVHSAQPDQPAVMRFFGERVMPRLRQPVG
jgi:alkanesulfonate monooxygenase SsuD/methylene tetrahydromethanopterin reductase-like flavin-dependent oxidoreductase (luciferase family)